MSQWANKRVLITGICGTVGSELLRQVLAESPLSIVGIDNNESDLFMLSEQYRDFPNLHFYIGDVRDRDKLMRKMSKIDIVLHAAALKHVILCEKSPRDAIQTNVLGTQNIIDAAIANHVGRVIFTSSDKAVNPTNVMGTSKLMGERMITAANAHRNGDGPIFSSARFGNVLGSRGSVIPLFKKQIEAGGPVTLTDTEMTRFVMTLQQAVSLVMESVFLAQGGEVFVTKMPVMRIAEMAAIMITELAPRYGHDPKNIELRVIGSKAGEKFYEELMNEEEIRRTVELEKYFVVIPAFTSVYEKIEYVYPGALRTGVDRPYNSAVEKPLGRSALRNYLLASGLLN
jgi:FlaA1/EpsC-like NDP-sugar epimerase